MPGEPPPRIVTLVVASDHAGLVCLPPLAVDTPWWQDIEPVVRAARDRFAIDVTVLRLLDTERARPHGGNVSYLVELHGAEDTEPNVLRQLASTPWTGTLAPHPLRLSYAEPGGPAADLQWAAEMLAEAGLEPFGSAVQVRTWNLSSIWRILQTDGTAWLKVVPPFFAHEGLLIAALQSSAVPRLIAHDGARLLLHDIPGEDLYDADLPVLLAMVDRLLDVQAANPHRVSSLLALGLPDWRATSLIDAIDAALEKSADELDSDELSILRRFVTHLPGRFERLADCGIPDTLVHGDFHPGNVRGQGDELTLLDWADAGVGHPLLDQAAFVDRIPVDCQEPVRAHWRDRCRERWPNSNPWRAAGLVRPIAAARQATIYQRFLDNIEPSERRYHRGDPAVWLKKAVALLREEPAEERG